MLDLLDFEKLRAAGPRRFLLLFAFGLSMLFFGLFVAIGVVIEGHFDANWKLLAVSLGFGPIMVALFGRRIWRLSAH